MSKPRKKWSVTKPRGDTVTVPRKLWKELLRVCECDILHHHGRRSDGTWGCLENCPACMVLQDAARFRMGAKAIV